MDKIQNIIAFIRVAETGSFSQASRDLAIGQATISKRIAQLEQSLGAKLINRSSRVQSLTEAGRHYYQYCVPIVDAIDEADAKVRSHSHQPQGTLRITTAVDFGRIVLAPYLIEFLQKYPEIRIDLVLSNYRLDLISGGIDVAVRIGEPNDSNLVAKPFSYNQIVTVASPKYIEQYGYPKTPNELSEHECIIYSASSYPRKWTYSDNGKTLTIDVMGRFECDSGETLLDMINQGMGIGFLPNWLVQPYIAEGALVELFREIRMPRSKINMVYPDRKHLALKTRCFVDFIAEQFRSPLPNGVI